MHKAVIIGSHVAEGRLAATFGSIPEEEWGEFFDANTMSRPIGYWTLLRSGFGPDACLIVEAPLCEPGTYAPEPDPDEEALCLEAQS